jgi:hypothetical protein
MLKNILLCAALLITSVSQSASAIELKVQGYTANSVTFTLTGAMPELADVGYVNFSEEIDLRYTGNLWAGSNIYAINSLSNSPILGSGNMVSGYTGGFGYTFDDYSWMYFMQSLAGLQGSNAAVTLSLGSGNFLNTLGTGTIDLFWGNLTDGAGVQNILLSSVSIVNGRVVGADTGEVPEPMTLALLGIGVAGLRATRRRKQA